MEDRKPSAIALFAAGLIAAIALALVYYGGMIVAAIALVFIVPGLLMLRGSPSGFGTKLTFESAILALGSSIALVVVLALVLHQFGALTRLGWLFLLAAFCVVAWLTAPRRDASLQTAPVAATPGLNRSLIATAVSVVAMVTFAVMLARSGALAHQQFTYTELWMTPYNGRDHNRVILGVRNRERQPITYDLEISLNGKTFARRTHLVLANEQQAVEELSVPFDETSLEQRVEARLYRTGPNLILYRRVFLSKQTEGAQ